MERIANPAGLRVLESLISLISDKDKIGKVLDEIHAARDEANVRIAAVGKIGEIGKLRTRAEEALAEAIDTLDGAKAEAEKILGEAGAKAKTEKARQKRADAILAAADDRKAALDNRDELVTARETELQSEMDRTTTLHAEATDLKVKADALIIEANERRERFKNFAATIQ